MIVVQPPSPPTRERTQSKYWEASLNSVDVAGRQMPSSFIRNIFSIHPGPVEMERRSFQYFELSMCHYIDSVPQKILRPVGHAQRQPAVPLDVPPSATYFPFRVVALGDDRPDGTNDPFEMDW